MSAEFQLYCEHVCFLEQEKKELFQKKNTNNKKKIKEEKRMGMGEG